MFTTNELYSQSTATTNRFLGGLAERVAAGAMLLVVESAGSYSLVKVGGREYPMTWLLDLVMLGKDGKGGMWEKIVGEESRWFRLGEGLKFPLGLENMRYLVRLYRRS